MPSLFVASRSPRHRTACFALYKALIQQAVRVPLPDDILRAPGLEGPAHPIKHLIRKSFRRNKNDTSPRLVISALRNGYKFLDLLSAARDPSTPEYHQIHTFLKDRQTRKSHALSLRALHPHPPPPAPSSAPNPSTIPLLTRVSLPHQPPRYEPTVRPLPLSQLGGTGVRRVPVLEKANFTPFLRLTKPQPPLVSRVIRQKVVRMTKVVEGLQAMMDEAQEAAQWEDRWEEILERSGLVEDAEGSGRKKGASYLGGVKQDIYHLRGRLLGLRLDDHARGVALQKLVMEERALAEKEKKERQERKRRERLEMRTSGGGDATVGSAHHDIVDAIRGDIKEKHS
ncbi:hypothetical protein NKR19_g7708 [Coniochaeta hoffmannii]|uniref:Complex 1 LYR protein domain-containing protein n=1 Tax=Coniochaeta hoffmannii TaxID=91930 RepID=A0AA38RR55_9PEZI|nr:hypothetical protein NKR19_g7708 [Coniochaeta hoffmannii]